MLLGFNQEYQFYKFNYTMRAQTFLGKIFKVTVNPFLLKYI